ncbi:MAG: hypothetical protein MUD14_29875 [Hydrococcus sp. Prado102]|jgi:hypothetical protein|nr:hypothetical protein [Hydrococcus sp. Prado102]
MSVPCGATSVVILNQQRQNLKCSDESDETSPKSDRNQGEYCTVVENGKVVVKPIELVENTDKA